MQFNSNSDFPASHLPPEQWATMAQPPAPFEEAESIPCACITTRLLIRAESRLVAGIGSGSGVGMGNAQHVLVGGANYVLKTAKGVLVRTPAQSVVQSGNGGGGWSDSSDSDNDENMMDDNNNSWPPEPPHGIMHDSLAPILNGNNTSIPSNNNSMSQHIERAYWLRRTLRTAIYGQVRYGIVLHRLNPPIQVMLPACQQHHPQQPLTMTSGAAEWVSVDWEATEEAVAVKEMSWEHIRAQRDRLAEDPIKEVAAMQYLNRWLHTEQQKHTMQQLINAQFGGINLASSTMGYANGNAAHAFPYLSASAPLPQAMSHAMPHENVRPYRIPQNMIESHVMMPLDLLEDNRNIYSIMPYCTGGELFDILEKNNRFTESQARFWMRQILQGLACLKEAGVTHRDLSLENLLVHNNNVLVIDMGMCLRVPYIDPHTKQRFLILPQGTCGKWHYMSPEICKNDQPFDGHAVDLWAAGVILFLMLTGFPPWEKPYLTDERFKYMTNGYLVQMMTEWKIGLTADAMDLLQRMFWLDPTDRLSLEQVWAHPWMTKKDVDYPC